MIREQRNRDKLQKYYDLFIEEGIIDPNVHPWVAESWQKSKKLGINHRKINHANHLNSQEFDNLKMYHQEAINCFSQFGETIDDFIREYDVCIALLDSDCRVLKRFTNPVSRFVDTMEGTSLLVDKIGTLSSNIVQEHKVPFWLFGPEVWQSQLHNIDSGAVPIIIDGKLSYIISLGVMEHGKLEQDVALSMLFTIRLALEMNIKQSLKLKAQEKILDATPFAVYHIANSDKVLYANKLGKEKLLAIHGYDEQNKTLPLKDVVLNYQHTPVAMGFQGISCYNRETTWITKEKTYEDITTVVPILNPNKDINSIVTVSMPIEDLRTLVAHASGYTAKYSLNSMVGNAKAFIQMKERAQRLAKNKNHILIQGEAGIGKQRLAHGIHMESHRKVGPLISINCGGSTPEILEQEFFGATIGEDTSHPGKLELASQGTLFIDEIEKLPSNIAKKLAVALSSKKICRIGESLYRNIDVRIISATDTNLNRMVVKKQFDEELFHILSKSIIRVPALRNRREDIPLLSKHIIEELSIQHQLPSKDITPAGMDMLYAYDWPGNIKQLQTVLELAFFHTDKPLIDVTDINLMGNIKPDSSWKKDKDVFIKAWKSAGGNISRLSNLLSVSRVTLYRYIRKYDLEK